MNKLFKTMFEVIFSPVTKPKDINMESSGKFIGTRSDLEPPHTGPKLSSHGLRLDNFEVCVPQGIHLNSGHVRLEHNLHYSLILTNLGNLNCDADVSIDGASVGLWRIPGNSSIEVERPADDTGKFTFYALDSQHAKKVDLIADDDLGLITVVFKPEIKIIRKRNEEILYSKRDYSEISRSAREHSDQRGGTGLAGESEQKFISANRIEYDFENFITIHLRLVCGDNGPRSLRKRSSVVPTFLPK